MQNENRWTHQQFAKALLKIQELMQKREAKGLSNREITKQMMLDALNEIHMKADNAQLKRVAASLDLPIYTPMHAAPANPVNLINRIVKLERTIAFMDSFLEKFGGEEYTKHMAEAK
jgi:uncharacterized protein YoaH (UPF0181 family)